MTPEELTQAIFKALVMFQKHQMEHFDVVSFFVIR